MKVVKSVLSVVAVCAMMSAGTAWAQCCCGGATYQGCGTAGGVVVGEGGEGAAAAWFGLR